MKIAIFDYVVTPNNAIGNCHRRVMNALAGEYDFTLFACEFDNPRPDRIRWIRVPALRRPLALLFVSFHLSALLLYLWHVGRRRREHGWVHGVESNVLFADVVHAQFCHRWFLQKHWKRCGLGGIRGWFRWVDHALHAWWEPWAFRRARRIVVASQGCARELKALYPYTVGKITVIPNPVECEKLARPAGFDRGAERRALGAGEEDLLVVFVALGQYERKGLPALLEALGRRAGSRHRLVVVGGQPDLVREYEARVARMGLEERVRFVGMQRDVRPYLWAADVFALPSHYEVFPLVALEAAAAGCLLMVAPLNGVEEFLVDGTNGVVVTPDADGVATGLERVARMERAERERMAAAAAECVRQYTLERFVAQWRKVYESQAGWRMEEEEAAAAAVTMRVKS